MRLILLVTGLLWAGLSHAQPLALVSGDDYKPYADSKLPEGGGGHHALPYCQQKSAR